MKTCTLCFLLKDDQVLLAMKKRGFGEGKWNGVGGKVKEEESIEEATVREAEEEIGVKIRPEHLDKVAEIFFKFKEKSDWDLICHVYFTREWQGEPVESEEMAPQWYKQDQLPFESMWVDDPHWLPLVLSGKKLNCEFCFGAGGDIIESYRVDEV